jgi:hypothetical protein
LNGDIFSKLSQKEIIQIRELYLTHGKEGVKELLKKGGRINLYESIISQLFFEVNDGVDVHFDSKRMFDYYINCKKSDQRQKLYDDVIAVHKRLHTRRILVDLEGGKNPKHYGIVVGKVQSGKTAHMLGLSALALDSNLDNSYNYNSFKVNSDYISTKIVIILSGLIDDLRIQTYNRFLNDFKGFDLTNLIHGPGSVKKDLTKDISFQNEIKEYLENARNSFQEPDKKLIIIVKKNYRVLDKITELIQASFDDSDEELFVGSWLIIDDECDYASQDKNFAGNQLNTAETATNESLRQMIKLARDTSEGQLWYVGYTATPYSNILSNPHVLSADLGPDLFPTGFISIIDPPFEHLDNGYYFNSVDGNTNLIIDDSVSFSDRLEQFVILHCLTKIIKESRNLDIHHTSMIHEVRFKEDHAETLRDIGKIISHYNANKIVFRNELQSELLGIKNIKEDELNQISDFIKNCSKNYLGKILNIELIELNRRKKELDSEYEGSVGEKEFEEELVYGAHPRNIIVTGGERISRGLTLEGLTVSLFFRTANEPSYDTMLQMARWNGYRDGYDDLVRIITSSNIRDDYQKIAIAEEDMRGQMRRYTDQSDPVIEIIELLKFNGMKLTGSLPSREFLNIMNVINDNYQSDKVFVTHPPELVNGNSTFSFTDVFIEDIEDIFEFHVPPKETDEGQYLVAYNVNSNIAKKYLQNYIESYESFEIACKNELKKIINNHEDDVDWNVAFALSPTKPQKTILSSDYEIGLSDRTPKPSKGFDPVYSSYPVASNIDLDDMELRKSPLLLIYFLNPSSINSQKLSDPIPLIMILRPNAEGIGGSTVQRWSGYRAGNISTDSLLNKGEDDE